jgi:hypothetical protein
MKLFIAALAALSLACTISPVVTDPGSDGGDIYDSCRRASRDYCRDALDTPPSELDKCVAEATYNCIAGTAP